MGRAELGSASQAHPWVFSEPSSAPLTPGSFLGHSAPLPHLLTTALAGKSRARLELTSGRKDTVTFQAPTLC